MNVNPIIAILVMWSFAAFLFWLFVSRPRKDVKDQMKLNHRIKW